MATLIDSNNLTHLLDKDILEIIGGKDLSQEKKEKLYTRMAETIQNRVIARIYDKLSEENAIQVDSLLESDDKNQLEQFLKEKNIDLAKMLLAEAIVYKSEMIELYRAADEKPNTNQSTQ